MNPNNRLYSIKDSDTCNTYSIRVKFARGEEVKFISHLDIMRTFERAIRRSCIPISYSMGFNPQPQIAFGLPLAVGVTSEAEYADFRLKEYIEIKSFIESLNKELPSGLEILDALLKDNNENIMATVCMASYTISVYTYLNMGINDIKKEISTFQKEKNIIIAKEGKKRTRDIDIKPMIYKLGIEECKADIYKVEKYDCKEHNPKQHAIDDCHKTYKISALLSAGGTANLRPELLVVALNMYMKTGFEIKNIHRIGLFVKKDGKAINPLDIEALK